MVVIQFIPVANKDYSILATPIFTLQNSKGRKIADTSKSSILVLGVAKEAYSLFRCLRMGITR